MHSARPAVRGSFARHPGRSRHGPHRAYCPTSRGDEVGRLTRVLFALDLQRDVDQPVLLVADELALTSVVQQLVGGHAVTLGLPDGVFEEAVVHAGGTHDQRVAIERIERHRGRDHLLGSVGDIEEVDTGLHADLVEYPINASTGALPRCTDPAARSVDLLGADRTASMPLATPRPRLPWP